MLRVLLEIWPALLPLVIYLLWMFTRRRSSKKRGDDIPGWKEGPWFWAILASAAILVVCLFGYGLFGKTERGTYHPPRMVDGQIVPGEITP